MEITKVAASLSRQINTMSSAGREKSKKMIEKKKNTRKWIVDVILYLSSHQNFHSRCIIINIYIIIFIIIIIIFF